MRAGKGWRSNLDQWDRADTSLEKEGNSILEMAKVTRFRAVNPLKVNDYLYL